MNDVAETLNSIWDQTSVSTVLCSDPSQADGNNVTAIPSVDHVINLRQIVRNSRRVVEGAAPFLSTEFRITAYTEQNGPPLLPFIFRPCSSESERTRRYAEMVVRALDHLHREYTGLPLDGNIAILTPDVRSARQLQATLRAESTCSGLDFVSALAGSRLVGAATGLNLRGHVQKDRVILDAVSNFDGMERLIVIAVGLDTHSADYHIKDFRCSLIYRAISRAHMFASVVQELVPSGWLAFLAVLRPKEEQALAEGSNEPTAPVVNSNSQTTAQYEGADSNEETCSSTDTQPSHDNIVQDRLNDLIAEPFEETETPGMAGILESLEPETLSTPKMEQFPEELETQAIDVLWESPQLLKVFLDALFRVVREETHGQTDEKRGRSMDHVNAIRKNARARRKMAAQGMWSNQVAQQRSSRVVDQFAWAQNLGDDDLEASLPVSIFHPYKNVRCPASLRVCCLEPLIWGRTYRLI